MLVGTLWFTAAWWMGSMIAGLSGLGRPSAYSPPFSICRVDARQLLNSRRLQLARSSSTPTAPDPLAHLRRIGRRMPAAQSRAGR
jgi:hypothetical protein